MPVRSRTRNLPPLGEAVPVSSPAEAIAVLEAHRVARGVRKWDIGKLTGYADATYPNWSSGRSNTQLSTFLDTAKALGLRVILAPQ